MSGQPTQVKSDTGENVTEQSPVKNSDVCPECGGNAVVNETQGESVCDDCGLVIAEDEIDHGPEWRAFDNDDREQKSRVGAPTTNRMHDKGLSTNIDWRDKDAYGNSLSSRKRKQMKRLRTWNERFKTKDSKERNLKQALGEIDRMASSLGLPDNIKETASAIYRRALEDGLLPGRSIEGVATAAVYASARQTGYPRSLDEITAVSRVGREEVSRTYRYIAREIGLKVEPADPNDYIPRIASEMGVSQELQNRATQLVEKAKKENLHSGKAPTSIAAGAIYASGLLLGEKLTQSEVADAANVSEVTVRNRYQDLIEKRCQNS